MNKRLKIASLIYVLIFLCNTLVWSNEAIAGKKKNKAKPEIKYIPGRILVKFRSDDSGELSARAANLMTSIGAFDSTEIPNLGVKVLQLQDDANVPALVEILNSQPDVEFAELDQVVAPDDMIPNDPEFNNEWHLTKIAAPQAWNTTTGLGNIVIAVCDTGVDSTHPDLASKLVPGWNMYNNNADTSDVYGHGTMVAGTVAASTNNQEGVASVAWGCLIMPVRISDPSGMASFSTIASGIRWAADHGARVANVSYRATTSSSVTSAASYMNSNGGVVTVAAGNDSYFDPSADNPYVLTVSATDSADNLYSWSNRGNNVDVSAPGNVYTCLRGGGYGAAFGTSFSAPIVAGLAALVMSTNPTLSPAQIQDKVKQSADDLGTAGWDANYGWGRVNAANSVSGAPAPDTTPPAVSFASPSSGANVSGTVTVQVTGDDNVGVTAVSFSVDGVQKGTDTTSPFSFSWDSTTAANGARTLSATATDAAGNSSTTSVTVTVNNPVPDTTAPTVEIVSPTNGSNVRSNISVEVTVSDNVGVTKVELYVNGELTSTAKFAPFATRWAAKRERPGTYNLQCKAYDAAGNVGVSSVVTVTR